ncbi:lipo domain protein [Streptococcus pneumoniae 2070335]|nr:lipo domain protein [Streptococcus pneumoniae 2070335]
MKIKKWLGLAALATVAGLALAACGNLEKKADNATTIKIATVNRSGSEEKRWDKIQELVKKTELPWNLQSSQTTHNQTKQLLMAK